MTDSTDKPTTTMAAVDQVSQENQAVITQFVNSKRVSQSMIKVGRQVHPDLSFESVIPLLQKFNHALLLSIPWSELENASLGSTPLKSWIQHALPGALAKHAISEANLAITKAGVWSSFSWSKMKFEEKFDHKETLADSSGEAAGLQFPIFSTTSIRVRDQIYISAVLEYLTAEVLELTGNEARSLSCRRCLPSHLAKSLSKDKELKELVMVKAKCATEMGLTPTGEPLPFPNHPNLVLDCFPHTQNKIRHLLEKHAWFHKPEKVEEVFAKFVAGELKSGDPKFHHLFVHPFAYLGLSSSGVFVKDDQFSFHPSGDGDMSMSDCALLSVAFDIQDAAGRSWPLVAECRGEMRIDAPLYSNYGGVFDRVTGQQVGSIISFTDRGGVLTLDTGIAEGYFSSFALHGFEEGKEPFKDSSDHFGKTSPSKYETEPKVKKVKKGKKTTKATVTELVAPKVIAQLERRRWEITALICAGMNLCSLLENLTACSAYHPPKVVARFARLLIRQAFDSVEVTSTLTNFHLPDVLVNLIGEYTLVELPYLPLFGASSSSDSMISDDDQCDKSVLHEIGRMLEDKEQAKQDKLDEEEMEA